MEQPNAPVDPAPVDPDGGLDVMASWSSLVRYHRLALAAMDASLRDRCGHSLDDYDVLHQLASRPAPMRMGELAGRLVVANSSCHRIVGRLAAADLVGRSRGDADRREVLVGLTPAGRRLHRRMAVVHTRDIDRWFGNPLDAAEHRELRRVLDRLERRASDLARRADRGSA